MRFFGMQQEAIAQAYLEQQGLTLLRKNFSSRFGEIDLIMLDGNTLCFVEVRYRKAATHGGAAASITRGKQKKLVKTALYFLLQECQYQNAPLRFDTVLLQQASGNSDINWIRGAFYAES